MGMLFPFSLQQLFGRMAEPFSGRIHQSGEAQDGDHELLWQCYAAGGMSEADLQREIAADPSFATYFESRKGHSA